MKIGGLARQAGTSVPTIRYYEQIGLLPRARRHDGGRRSYGSDDVKRLTFIRRCRGFGFPIEQVRALAQVMQDPAATAWKRATWRGGTSRRCAPSLPN